MSTKNNKVRPVKILVIDDEAPIREVLSASLKDEGHFVKSAPDGDQGLRAMREFMPEIVFLDIWMPGSMDGIGVLTQGRMEFPQTEFIMISGHGTIETAVRSTKLGAWDFIEKPLSMDKISICISNIVQYQQEREEKQALLNKLRKSIAMVGEAPTMIQLKSQIVKAASHQSWLLLKGEKGSGRQLTAMNIHYMSHRASRPFVELASGSIPENLIEAEIFGYEKGAHVGADRAQKGKLELAAGGTLFIDELTNLSRGIQEKLLRVLQEGKFFRVGGKELLEVDVRVIAATTTDPETEIKSGKLLEDLYHRINVMPIRIPSLREHPEDIPALVMHFGDQAAREAGAMRKQISDQALALMVAHTWSGNIRELRNFIERVYILTPSEFVDAHDVRFAGLGIDSVGDGGQLQTELSTFREARAKFEKEYIQKKIAENNGNISRTAEVIGLERSYLHRKIKAFGISAEEVS